MLTYDDIKIKIDGVYIPPPTELSISLEDIDMKSGRNIKDAVMYRNRLRSDIKKISLTYTIDDTDSISKLLRMIEPESFNVELFDLKNNKRMVKSCYAGSKSYKLICVDRVWVNGFKVNLIER